jgi:redox-sensitive bicupin YhaK (pirin superfamily)
LITLRRSEERSHVRRRAQDGWVTYYPQSGADRLAGGFGPLELLKEDRIPPGARVPLHPRYDAEILTYVVEGALAQDDSSGRSSVIHAGEFQRASAAQGDRHRERNGSRKDWAHVVQIWLRPWAAGPDSSAEKKRFCAAERRGVLCVVASPDGRNGSLCIHQDALIHSAMLFPGQHVVHELSPERSVWLQVVNGEAALGEIVLAQGDGAGICAERAVSLTARKETEVLLLDLGA